MADEFDAGVLECGVDYDFLFAGGEGEGEFDDFFEFGGEFGDVVAAAAEAVEECGEVFGGSELFGEAGADVVLNFFV